MPTISLKERVDERVLFTFATPSPLTLKNLLTNDVITDFEIVITTAFDDGGASLQVGTVASPNLIFGASDSKIQLVGIFKNDQNFVISVVEILRLIITSGASTQGAGYVLFRVRR